MAARPEHAEMWATWRAEPQTRRFNPLLEQDIDTLRRRLAHDACDIQDVTADRFRWMVSAAGEIVGTVSATAHWAHRSAEIGYMLGAASQGRGLGTAAVSTLVQLLWTQPRFDRLFATISSGNTASERVVSRLGFTREGIMRGHWIIDGRRTDQVIYGVFRDEVAPLSGLTPPGRPPLRPSRS